MGDWVRRLTVDQWRAIDSEYRSESAHWGGAAAILVTIAVSLAIGRFFGSARFPREEEWILKPFSDFPHPGLHTWIYWSLFKLVSYGLLPVVCIRLVLKRRVIDHGLRLVNEPKVWLLYLGMLLATLPVVYIASMTDSFLDTYPKYRDAGRSWPQLLLWEFAYGFQFFMLEFFFRGFIIFSLARYIGSLSIFVMIVPYSMIHYGKPFAECIGSILAGITLGTIALRTRTIYGGVALHCGVAWAMDLFALGRKGALSRLFEG